MNITDLSGINSNGVVVEASGDTSDLTIRFAGNADSRVKDRIQSFLLELHDLAREHHIAKVRVDFRQLEFMNSACFKAFVTWLAQVRELDDDEQYAIHFLSNDKIHWQRRSLRAMSCFAANVVRIEN